MKENFQQARIRGARRKSPWNIALIIIQWVIWFLLTFFLVKWMIYLPFDKSLPFSALAGDENGFKMAFIILSLLVFSKPMAMMITNILFRLLPNAKKEFEEESLGRKGTEFKSSTLALIKLTLIIGLILVPLVILAAFSLKS